MKRFFGKLYYPIVALFVISLFSFLYITYKKVSIPDTFTVVTGENAAVFEENNIKVENLKQGHNAVDLKLFGVVPIKSVSIDVVDRQMLIPCGTPVGIYIETEGVLVIDVVELTDINGNNVTPALSKLVKGDYILEANGMKTDSKSTLIDVINNSKGEDIVLKIKRNGAVSEVKVTPAQTGNNEYKLGIWIRDNTQGVGMLTYVTMDGEFAALGHGIHDPDTESLMELSNGALFEAEILDIVKGKKDSPGELIGSIYYSRSTKIGVIKENTDKGIYGTFGAEDAGINMPMQIGYKQDIEIGAAQIYTTVNGALQAYDIEIIDVNLSTKTDDKGFMIKVTDPKLIEITGGIVQGMSGSPVIQNGKIVGAVTHVLVNDPTKGYGIFIETMLEESE